MEIVKLEMALHITVNYVVLLLMTLNDTTRHIQANAAVLHRDQAKQPKSKSLHSITVGIVLLNMERLQWYFQSNCFEGSQLGESTIHSVIFSCFALKGSSIGADSAKSLHHM